MISVLCRDLKVENVFLGLDGVWKVCDFGSNFINYKYFDFLEEMGLEEDCIRKFIIFFYWVLEVSV